jgi:hypothetical protein
MLCFFWLRKHLSDRQMVLVTSDFLYCSLMKNLIRLFLVYLSTNVGQRDCKYIGIEAPSNFIWNIFQIIGANRLWYLFLNCYGLALANSSTFLFHWTLASIILWSLFLFQNNKLCFISSHEKNVMRKADYPHKQHTHSYMLWFMKYFYIHNTVIFLVYLIIKILLCT